MPGRTWSRGRLGNAWSSLVHRGGEGAAGVGLAVMQCFGVQSEMQVVTIWLSLLEATIIQQKIPN